MQHFWDTDALWPIREKPIIMFIFVIIISHDYSETVENIMDSFEL